MKLRLLNVVCFFFVCVGSIANDIKPVTGTWLNLVWQDDRNNYMNPPGSDYTDPALWTSRVEDLHGMGVDVLVLMQVSNDSEAFYPSEVMPKAYPADRKSPVDAIMETAASLGMKVFLSCGWARNQDDDLRDRFVMERQVLIMQELTVLYKDSPAFYGWYLPVESAMIPVLPKHAVDGVNRLSARAKELTPGKKVMISPYGICFADLDNPLFEERIASLDVDIIAYQDEVGCVRVPQPLPEMKEHFCKLAEIHSRTGIEFWANVESFTWEKPTTNSRKSALVPAAFGRYLSQIVAVSQAGAGKVLSFAICGIYDRTHPRAYNDYMSWRGGDAGWKLLEHILSGDVVCTPCTVSDKAAAALCDGVFGQEKTSDPSWVCFPDGKMSVVMDLGQSRKVTEVAARFLNYKKKNMTFPIKVIFSFSRDGEQFKNRTEVNLNPYEYNLHDCWTDLVRCGCESRARFVKVEAFASDGMKLMCDEILINPINNKNYE